MIVKKRFDQNKLILVRFGASGFNWILILDRKKLVMSEYKLEHDRSAHISLLKSTIDGWSETPSDIFIISREGHKIFTNR